MNTYMNTGLASPKFNVHLISLHSLAKNGDIPGGDLHCTKQLTKMAEKPIASFAIRTLLG